MELILASLKYTLILFIFEIVAMLVSYYVTIDENKNYTISDTLRFVLVWFIENFIFILVLSN